MPHVEPLERLLNLVALLLEARTPMTFEQIRETLPDAYGQQDKDSAKRMFERDKDTLRDYGIPLELVATDIWEVEQGYTIPKEAYYLPEIAFTPEELAALFVAAQTGGGTDPAEQAVRKLLYGADGGVLAGLAGGPLASGTPGTLLLAAADAAQRRRRVRFGYRNSQGALTDRTARDLPRGRPRAGGSVGCRRPLGLGRRRVRPRGRVVGDGGPGRRGGARAARRRLDRGRGAARRRGGPGGMGAAVRPGRDRRRARRAA